MIAVCACGLFVGVCILLCGCEIVLFLVVSCLFICLGIVLVCVDVLSGVVCLDCVPVFCSLFKHLVVLLLAISH